VEGARPRGRPKKTWSEIVERLSGMYTEQGNAMDRIRWMKQIRDN